MSEEKLEKHGIEGLKALADLVVALGECYDAVMADGKVSKKDIFHLGGIIPETLALAPAAGNIPAEVKDLSADERNELVAYFVVQFDLENESAEASIEGIAEFVNEHGVSLVSDILRLYRLLKNKD